MAYKVSVDCFEWRVLKVGGGRSKCGFMFVPFPSAGCGDDFGHEFDINSPLLTEDLNMT